MATHVRYRYVLPALLGCALALMRPGEAGEPHGPELVPWAPRWEIGDWWIVRVYQRDLQVNRSAPMPDWKPQEKGPPQAVPPGFERSNRFLFRVTRREHVRYPDDPPDVEPEPFLVVQVRSMHGLRPRKAELWYAEIDCSLSRVVLDPGTTGGRTYRLQGNAQLDVTAGRLFAFPLEWPVLRRKKGKKAKLQLAFGQRFERIEQATRMRSRAFGPEVQVRLRRAGEAGRGPRAPKALFSWRKGEPYWHRLRTQHLLGLLEQHGGRRDRPR